MPPCAAGVLMSMRHVFTLSSNTRMFSRFCGLVYSTLVCPAPAKSTSLAAIFTASLKSFARYIASSGLSFSTLHGSCLPTSDTSAISTRVPGGTPVRPRMPVSFAMLCPTMSAFRRPSMWIFLPAVTASSLDRMWQPRLMSSRRTVSYTLSTTTMLCSLAQMTPLSNVLERMMEETAICRSAVSSMMAGVLPLPTPSAAWPDEYALCTMAGPPVARMSLMSGDCIRAWLSGTVGFSSHWMRPGGAPAASAASRTMRAASAVHFTARGCGDSTSALRVLSAMSDLKMAVADGLVVGITPAMTPIGSATFVMPPISSSSTTPHVFMCLYLL